MQGQSDREEKRSDRPPPTPKNMRQSVQLCIPLAFFHVSCAATRLCSPASSLKVSHIASRAGLKHFRPLHLALPPLPLRLVTRRCRRRHHRSSSGRDSPTPALGKVSACASAFMSPSSLFLPPSVKLKDYIKLRTQCFFFSFFLNCDPFILMKTEENCY